MADLFDAMNINTRATGSWKKGKAPDFPLWPRPDDKPESAPETKKTSVADLYDKFARR